MRFRDLTAVFLLLILTGCRPHGDNPDGNHTTSLLDRLESSHPDTSAGSATMAALETDVRSTVAVDIDGPAQPFRVPERKLTLVRYPCSSCHTLSLAKMLADTLSSTRRAHWEIDKQHAPESILRCTVCHAEANLDRLRSITGQPIDFDHSYRLCGQCHATQFRDWQGGAHGKRASGWAARRVVYTCVQCHNPHAPAYGKRWPARFTGQQP